METWKNRDGRRLTLQGYVASGGLRGAIAKTADVVYQSFNPQEQAIARNIFLRLTELGEGVADTRRRVRLDELVLRTEDIDIVRSVLRRLATQESRLVTTSDEDIEAATDKGVKSVRPSGVSSPYVEVAHEALIRERQRLRGWLNEDRDLLRTHRDLLARWGKALKRPTMDGTIRPAGYDLVPYGQLVINKLAAQSKRLFLK